MAVSAPASSSNAQLANPSLILGSDNIEKVEKGSSLDLVTPTPAVDSLKVASESAGSVELTKTEKDELNKKKIESLNSQIMPLVTQENRIKAAIVTTKQDQVRLEQELVEGTKKIEELRAANKAVTTKVSDSRETVKTLTAIIRNLRLEDTQQQSQLKKLKAELAILDTRKSSLKTQLETYEKELSSNTQDKARLNQEKAALTPASGLWSLLGY